MAKLTAWIVTIVGLLLVLGLLIPATFTGEWVSWVIALGVLVIGIGKLMRNYQQKRKK